MKQLTAWAIAPAMIVAATAAFAATFLHAADINNVRLGRDVVLEGYIYEHVRDDYYRFRDGTGSIRVEIDGWVRRGRTFTPTTRVRISGEVERGAFARYVSAERVTVLK